MNPGAVVGKAQQLIDQHDAIELEAPPKSLADVPNDKALVCVVDNRVFDAAGYIYHDLELAAFTLPDDPRPKRWLLMDKDYVEENAK